MEELRIDVPEELARALTVEAVRRGCEPGEALLAIAAEYFAKDPVGKHAVWSSALAAALDLPDGAEAEELLLGDWLDEAEKTIGQAPATGDPSEEAFKRWMSEYQLEEMDEV
jgi:hypothetical protein